MPQPKLLAEVKANQSVHIMQDDMIHITWKHVTIRLNATGLIYLVDYLEGKRRHHFRVIGFDLTANPDDGYQLWIQDVGLRLSAEEFDAFKQLLQTSLSSLRQMGSIKSANHLPHLLKLTVAASPASAFSQN